MYKSLHLFVLCLAWQSASADPVGKEAPELTALKAAYQTQVASVTARYKEKLNELIKSQSQKGDLDGALATRAELDAIGGAPVSGAAVISESPSLAQSPFYGTSWKAGSREEEGVLEFFKDGTYLHTYKGEEIKGTWKTGTDPLRVSLEAWPSKPDASFLLAEKGTYCIRNIDGLKYKKADPRATSTKRPTPSGR